MERARSGIEPRSRRKLHRSHMSAAALEHQLNGNRLGGVAPSAQKIQKRRPVLPRDKKNEWSANQIRPRGAKQRDPAQVDLRNVARGVEGDVRDRGKIVEIGITIARFLQKLLRFDQLL